MLDAIISLPLLGYLLMPGTTSYSTSLNILFFYMTWSTLVLSQPALRVELIGSLAPRFIFFLIPSTLFLLFDSVLPTLAVSIKIQGASGLPTRTGGVQRQSTRQPKWYRVVGLSLFNIALATALQAGIELLLTKVFLVRSALKVTTTLPMPWSILKDLAKGMIAREFLQYYIHRYVLHSWDNTFSRLHKRYHHSITAPYSFAAHYDHPLPYLLWRFVPLYLPAMIFRFHMLTYLLIVSTVTLEETLTLSGYTTIPGIMLGGITRRQDSHNKCKGRGNYAPWGLLDWVSSTSVGATVMDDAQDEAEKHDLAGRSEKLIEDAKEGGKDGLRALSGRRKKKHA